MSSYRGAFIYAMTKTSLETFSRVLSDTLTQRYTDTPYIWIHFIWLFSNSELENGQEHVLRDGFGGLSIQYWKGYEGEREKGKIVTTTHCVRTWRRFKNDETFYSLVRSLAVPACFYSHDVLPHEEATLPDNMTLTHFITITTSNNKYGIAWHIMAKKASTHSQFPRNK